MSESGEPEPNGGDESGGETGPNGTPEPTGGPGSSEDPGPGSAGGSTSTAVGTGGERVNEARERGFPVVRGAVYGTFGVAATYLLHLYMTVVTMSSATPVTYEADNLPGPPEEGEVTTNLVSEFVVAGWDYFQVFGVTFKAGQETVRLGLSGAPNYAAPLGVGGPFNLAGLLLFLFTMGMPVVLGYAIVGHVNPKGVAGAVTSGIAVVPPYFAFAVFGGLLFRHSYSDVVLVDSFVDSAGLNGSRYLEPNASVGGVDVVNSILLRPDFVDAVVLAGVVFPVAFAVTGALLARRTELVEAVSRAIERRL